MTLENKINDSRRKSIQWLKNERSRETVQIVKSNIIDPSYSLRFSIARFRATMPKNYGKRAEIIFEGAFNETVKAGVYAGLAWAAYGIASLF